MQCFPGLRARLCPEACLGMLMVKEVGEQEFCWGPCSHSLESGVTFTQAPHSRSAGENAYSGICWVEGNEQQGTSEESTRHFHGHHPPCALTCGKSVRANSRQRSATVYPTVLSGETQLLSALLRLALQSAALFRFVPCQGDLAQRCSLWHVRCALRAVCLRAGRVPCCEPRAPDTGLEDVELLYLKTSMSSFKLASEECYQTCPP